MPMRVAVLSLALLSAAACGGAAPSRIPDPGAGLEALQSAIDRDGVFRCHSPGGSLMGGLLLGLHLHEKRIPVLIEAGDFCGSAAALAALGGSPLYKSGAGALVFHGPTPAMSPFARGLMQGAFAAWDVPRPLAARVLALRPGELWKPDPQDLRPLLEARAR